MATLETSPAQIALNEQGPVLQAAVTAFIQERTETLGALSLTDLRTIAAPLNIPISGTKPQMIARLIASTPAHAAAHTLRELETNVTEQNRAVRALTTLVENAKRELADLDTRRVRDLALPLIDRIESERYWLERDSVRLNAMLGAASHAATFLSRYEAAPDNTDPRDLAANTYMNLMVRLVRPGYTRNGPGADAALAAEQEGIKGFLFAIWRILPEAAAHIAMA